MTKKDIPLGLIQTKNFFGSLQSGANGSGAPFRRSWRSQLFLDLAHLGNGKVLLLVVWVSSDDYSDHFMPNFSEEDNIYMNIYKRAPLGI